MEALWNEWSSWKSPSVKFPLETPGRSQISRTSWLARIPNGKVDTRLHLTLPSFFNISPCAHNTLAIKERMHIRANSRRCHKFTCAARGRLLTSLVPRWQALRRLWVVPAAILLLLISTGDLGQRNRKFLVPAHVLALPQGVAGSTRGNERTDSSSLRGALLVFCVASFSNGYSSRLWTDCIVLSHDERAFCSTQISGIQFPCMPYSWRTVAGESPRVILCNQITFALRVKSQER